MGHFRKTDLATAWRFAILCGLMFSAVRGAGNGNLSSTASSLFVDATEKMGIRFQQLSSPTSKKYLLETMGSGVALFDYDNDARLDIFFANGARIKDPMPEDSFPVKGGPEYWNRLYHQRADGTFEDVTEKAGLSGVGYSTG